MTNAQSMPDPHLVKTSDDFVTEMRRLKAYSGLTFRELERRAAASGDVMPYSTIASALRRSGLPQETLVGAFVRACGCTPEQVAEWIAARRRLAVGEVAPGPAPDGVPPAEPTVVEQPERARRRTLSVALFGAAACTGALLVTIGAATGLFGTEKNRGRPALGAVTPARTGPSDGWYRIKPTTGRGDKCLDIGNDRDWQPIVIQWTCAMSNDEQRFWIRTLGGGAYQIQSASQRAGKRSCLSLNSPSEHAVVRLRPCGDSAADQRFSVERASTRPSFRLRSLAGPAQDCLGLDPTMAAQGADVIQRLCDSTEEQFVLIGPPGQLPR